MNALFCVGCDKYDSMNPLGGAERDANQIFETLSDRAFYSKDRSAFLLSPSFAEMSKSLAATFRGGRLSVFTFFFAGHAAGKNGSFFMALRDSEYEALSTTAFPLSRLFEMVNEFEPAQVNIIIDACDAGNATSSIHTLLRSEATGTIRASGIAFLGACAAEQTAGETDEGGLLTRSLLRVIRKETDFATGKPYLELSDISAHVSEQVTNQDPEQRPITWSLNLFGSCGFMFNPGLHLDTPLPPLSVSAIDPGSSMGSRITEFSSEIWDEYRSMSKDFDPARLNQLLDRLLSTDDIEIKDRVKAISGLLASFSAVAFCEGELLTRQLCSATCICSLLPWASDPIVCSMIRAQLRSDFHEYNNLLPPLLTEMQNDPSRLLAHNGVLADVYYLPIRVTQLLGLIGALAIIGRKLSFETERSKSMLRDFAGVIIANYSKHLIALDDEQGASLYIFLKAAKQNDWADEACEVVQNLYADAAKHCGKFKRAYAGGNTALEHLLVITGSQFATTGYSPAKPSSLLAIILLGGIWFDCGGDWDLRAFDRHEIGLFLPTNFRDFGKELMEYGLTHTWTIGFGVWNIKQLEEQFRAVILSRKDDIIIPPEVQCLCVLASLLFPDRIPLCLEF